MSGRRPEKVDDALDAFRDNQLPRCRQQSGYKGFTLLADRGTGEVMGISFWENESDLKSADNLGREAREGIQQAGGGQGEIQRRDWELILDDEL